MLRIFFLFILGCASTKNKPIEYKEGFLKDFFQETLLDISLTKTIFILSNTNNKLQEGDFLTISLKGKSICRALVTKIQDKKAAINIKKIYSLTYWSLLKKNLILDILRGDESELISQSFKKKDLNVKNNDLENSLQDSFEDIESTENKFFYIGLSLGLDVKKDSLFENTKKYKFFPQYLLQIGFKYHVLRIENFFGLSYYSQYPSEGMSTFLLNAFPRIKLEFSPNNSLFLGCFAGMRVPFYISSEDAGTSADPVLAENEKTLINYLRTYNFDFGIYAITKIVPGWSVEFSSSLQIPIQITLQAEF